MRLPPIVPGDVFGRLTVVKEIEKHKSPGGHLERRFQCICICGKSTIVHLSNLRAKHVTSCGCWRTEKLNKQQGLCKSTEYRIWQAMILRCTNPRDQNWKHYGGRGIQVCDRWRNSFSAFLSDMGRRPTLKHTLDRYPDMNGSYEPSNARWATRKEQAQNTRRNRFIDYNGKSIPLSEAARSAGINPGTLYSRLKKGLTEGLFDAPTCGQRKRCA